MGYFFPGSYFGYFVEPAKSTQFTSSNHNSVYSIHVCADRLMMLYDVLLLYSTRLQLRDRSYVPVVHRDRLYYLELSMPVHRDTVQCGLEITWGSGVI